MKKKINMFLLSVGALSIFITMAFSVAVFYDSFKQEVFDNLKTYANILEMPNVIENIKNDTYDADVAEMRITLIAYDGTVLYDTYTNPQEMENHGDRPEVIEALASGESSVVRNSSTMEKNIFYYAKDIGDGMVLRVAKESGSIWSIFNKIIPMMLAIAFVLFLACMAVSFLLVRSFVRPIEELANNMDDYYRKSTYKELVPFIDKINQQHEDIVKNARMRQEFTANVSHELKTPLTSISGYSELIENKMTNENDVVRFATEIHRNSSRLLTMINDIIKLSELDSTDTKMQFEDVDLYEIAKSSVATLQVNADMNHVKLLVSGQSCIIKANRFMVEELIYNLCDNGIRYNVKDGTVYVSVSKAGDKTVLSVKDTGIGISEDNTERIFERFYRVDKSRSKSTGGTGLGLAIVKHIVSQHNAQMQLESKIGIGTEIKILF